MGSRKRRKGREEEGQPYLFVKKKRMRRKKENRLMKVHGYGRRGEERNEKRKREVLGRERS